MLPSVLCNLGNESHEHLFFGCYYSGQIWAKVLNRFQINRAPYVWFTELNWAVLNLSNDSFGNTLYKQQWCVMFGGRGIPESSDTKPGICTLCSKT